MGWSAVVLAFPWSNAFMSVATGLLALALLTSRHREKAVPLGKGRPFLSPVWSAGALVFLVLWSGMSGLWSEEWAGAVHDVRIKLPLCVAALALVQAQWGSGTEPIKVDGVLKAAIFSAWAATIAIVALDAADGAPMGGREASRFISHIRFGLWWAILLPWACAGLPKTWSWAALAGALLAWSWTESLTGILAGFVTAVWWVPLLLGKGVRREGLLWPSAKATRWMGAAVMAMLVMASVGLYRALPTDFPDPEGLRTETPRGEPYVHRLNRRATENGHFIWTEVAWGELAASWRARMPAPSFEEVNGRLIRFLASKGMPKDADGVAGLSDAELLAIAEGYSSVVEWKQVGWVRRWNRIRFNWGQWLDGRESSDASLLARGAYQSVAWSAIQDRQGVASVLFGCGSGEVQRVLNQAYEKHRPQWRPEQRRRPHNQFLTLWLGLGVVGVLCWVIALFGVTGFRLAHPALLVLFLSCMFEDTLETQAGVTLAMVIIALPAFLTPLQKEA